MGSHSLHSKPSPTTTTPCHQSLPPVHMSSYLHPQGKDKTVTGKCKGFTKVPYQHSPRVSRSSSRGDSMHSEVSLIQPRAGGPPQGTPPNPRPSPLCNPSPPSKQKSPLHGGPEENSTVSPDMVSCRIEQQDRRFHSLQHCSPSSIPQSPGAVPNNGGGSTFQWGHQDRKGPVPAPKNPGSKVSRRTGEPQHVTGRGGGASISRWVALCSSPSVQQRGMQGGPRKGRGVKRARQMIHPAPPGGAPRQHANRHRGEAGAITRTSG